MTDDIHVPPQLPSSVPCKIAFVAEAPSDEEVSYRVDGHLFPQPLVGPSGRVFNSMLRAANLERSDFLITNVFDQQAPENDVTGWMKDEVRVAENFARLNAELTLAQPNVIVPLGGTALWALTGQTKISAFRGAVTKATRIVPGAKLLPTYHPAAVIKNWQYLPIVVGDFIKANRQALLGPQMVYPKVELFIEPTVQDCRDWALECHKADLLSVDIETGWGQITAIAFAPTPYRSLSIPFLDLRQPNKSYWRTTDEEFEVWRIVEEICENPVPKLGQNFIYDLFWLYKVHGIGVRNYREDTRLRHKVMWPELPADLGNMAATYTDIGSWKSWGGKYQQEKKDG